MLQPYRDVLARPGALAFSSAGVLARLPMSMVGIGIILMVSEIYGSYGLGGRISAVYVIVHAICSPRLARLVDRHGQARVMRPAVLVTAAGLTGLVGVALVVGPTWALYVLAAVTGSSVGSMGSLVRARWSHVLSNPRHVHTAYSLESALDELVFIIGPIVATLLATGVTPVAGLIVPVAAVLVGGHLLLAQRRTEPPVTVHPAGTRHRSVMRSGGMVVLALVFVAMGAIFGATDVATVAFAEEQGTKSAAGLLLGIFAAGSMLSGLGYGARHWVSPLWKRFAIGMVALAAGVSLFFFVTSIPVLAVVMFVTGFAIAPTLINGNGLVQHFVPRDRLTEGLTWVGTSLGVGVSFGASIAGSLIDRDGSHGGFLVVIVSAGLAVVAVLASLRTLRRSTRTIGGPVDEPTEAQIAAGAAGAAGGRGGGGGAGAGRGGGRGGGARGGGGAAPGAGGGGPPGG
ncbi:MFS transporter, partial [Actinotalea sp. K2]|uniref:MFS transporter n=1 Tax=Actinotalea sp. K2 TaxID=2939438 RepID=UPI0027E1BAEB